MSELSEPRSEALLASPRGFCAGVDRAIEIVEIALERFGSPVYVRHEIVHNRHVVEELRAKGAVFVEDPADAPRGAVLIFSAHGVAPSVREAAEARGQTIIDATCPLVTKVHLETLRMARQEREIVLVGHAGHVEVEGTLGHAPGRMHLVQGSAVPVVVYRLHALPETCGRCPGTWHRSTHLLHSWPDHQCLLSSDAVRVPLNQPGEL